MNEKPDLATPLSLSPLEPPPLPVPAREPVPASPPPAPARDPRAAWPLPLRLLFRFAFLYLVLYNMPFPLGVIPGTEEAALAYGKTVEAAAGFFGKTVLGLAEAPASFPTGSGDTPIEYCKAALFAATALVASAAWSLAARRSLAHPRLHALLRIHVRYVLAAAMLGYGFAKVFKSQFQMPEGESLFTPLGQKSPMGLLWSFMGFSTAYTIFVGAAEVLGGTLVLFRRTVTLGALVSAAVMLNVTLLNVCYDVPVKLYSFHLLAMAVCLALPDLSRLVRFFVANAPVPPAVLRPFPVPGPRIGRDALTLLKLLCAGYLVVTSGWGGYQTWKTYGESAPRGALDGSYSVVTFDRDGQAIPVEPADARRWKRLSLHRRGFAAITTANDAVEYYSLRVDEEKHEVGLTARTRPGAEPPESTETILRFEEPAPNELLLTGDFDGAPLAVRLRRFSKDDFFLLSRGFHWIQDYPVNR